MRRRRHTHSTRSGSSISYFCSSDLVRHRRNKRVPRSARFFCDFFKTFAAEERGRGTEQSADGSVDLGECPEEEDEEEEERDKGEEEDDDGDDNF